MTWTEFVLALWKSAAVTIGSAIGPAVVALGCYPAQIHLAAAAVAAVLSGLGWVLAIWLVKHPAMHELDHVAEWLARMLRTRRQPHPDFLAIVEPGQAAVLPSEVK